ncbi:prepilin-type N-terminal cleavage/methylation domain-containing protein [Cellulomonas sp. IC4_254]|uniref:prepilin-type N-terminal cleavage/methylation domain-containing protein n=1 Tax=Cellulomonas sp. IC4_254 TaxID=2714040 RepID=UPI001420C28C|nr:prepilin-type N-terminal cleavage/methylation domain-containing protein [Cellulomonas sp. IC4_254]NHT16212.1 prepilin-type N-terminal cleavage/methylation domain-containing protein [Cellulomonas sp. IC4_254]
MHARIREVMDKRQNGEKGFTLIELLVVIIIIGILAAIAIPAFLNQRQKAWASQVESDLKNAAIAAESYAVGNNGSYEDLTTDLLKSNGYNPTKDVTVTLDGAPTVSGYKLKGVNANLDGKTWTYDSATGVITPPAN